MKQNQKVPAASILFYVISVILLLVFAFQVYYSYDYISGYDLDFAVEWKAVFSIYFGQCVLPFTGAVITYGIGLMFTKLSSLEMANVAPTKEKSVDDEAMEDLVSSLKNAKDVAKTKKTEEKVNDAKKTESDEKAVKTEKKEKPVAKKAPAKKAVNATEEKEEDKVAEDSNFKKEVPIDKVEA